jgi:P-type E1-E2 ATPase
VKNEAVYDVYRDGTWTVVASKDLLVGDIIKIVDGQRIPSDIVLIGSGIDNGTHAWVDTKDLDGETNLKPKSVPLNILKAVRCNWEAVESFNCMRVSLTFIMSQSMA